MIEDGVKRAERDKRATKEREGSSEKRDYVEFLTWKALREETSSAAKEPVQLMEALSNGA
jgi:hypothetical protein